MSEAKHSPMVVAAARVLCQRVAEACNVDADDSWKLDGDEHIADAAAMLNAAGAPDLLEALQEVLPMLEAALMIQGKPAPGSIGHKARAAIAKATGAAS